jgi:hypothetical protein
MVIILGIGVLPFQGIYKDSAEISAQYKDSRKMLNDLELGGSSIVSVYKDITITTSSPCFQRLLQHPWYDRAVSEHNILL